MDGNEADLDGFVQTLARETHRTEREVRDLVFRTGVKQLKRERLLAKYIRGEIGRDEAIDALGIDWVQLADDQRQAVAEDIRWALGD